MKSSAKNYYGKIFSINIDVDTVVADEDSYDFVLAQRSFTRFIPRLLDILQKYDIKATFFIVAKFARDKTIARSIKALSRSGHEIGNHSLLHCKHLAFFSYREIYKDISEADKILSDIVGQKIYGFRSPGYTVSPDVLRVLYQLDYIYDSSLNTSLFYYCLKLFFLKIFRVDAKLIALQPFSYHFLPDHPFRIDCDSFCVVKEDCRSQRHSIYEIPIPVVPVISYPFVGTLMNKNKILGKFLYYCLHNRKYLHLGLHDFEFAERLDLHEVKNLCAMTVVKDVKKHLRFYEQLIKMIVKEYKVVTLKDIAFSLLDKERKLQRPLSESLSGEVINAIG